MIDKLLGIIIATMLIALIFGLLVVLISEFVFWSKCPKERQGYRCKHRPGECGRDDE